MANFERLKHCEDKQILNGVVFFTNSKCSLSFQAEKCSRSQMP